MYHKPVMLEAALEGLAVKAGGTYVDATFGGGGHARAILQRLGEGRLVAFDQDEDALANLPDDDRLTFLNQNFRYMKNFLKLYGYLPVDGILADLGVSSHQFDQAGRGFSTRLEGPLDMRMNRHSEPSAKTVVNEYDTGRLAEVLRLYGELRQSRKIAAAIDQARKEQPLETTGELTDLLKRLAPRGRENKFMAQVFQALRIEVNSELGALRELLIQSEEVLKDGGRLVVISYHSLEDRLGKNYMRAGNFSGEPEKDFYGRIIRPFVPLWKPRTPEPAEVEENSRARSARLRVAEKIKNQDGSKPI